jgi:Zn-dependent protease
MCAVISDWKTFGKHPTWRSGCNEVLRKTRRVRRHQSLRTCNVLDLIAWVGFAYWQTEHTVEAVVAGILFILALFACVLLHEFGHALTAKRFGIKTRDITLLPIGGVARLQRMPEDPKQELLVTLAGPAVKVVIAGAIFILMVLTETLAPIGTLTLTTGSFWERLMLLNVVLVVFNLIPAFPMDGGRKGVARPA